MNRTSRKATTSQPHHGQQNATASSINIFCLSPSSRLVLLTTAAIVVVLISSSAVPTCSAFVVDGGGRSTTTAPPHSSSIILPQQTTTTNLHALPEMYENLLFQSENLANSLAQMVTTTSGSGGGGGGLASFPILYGAGLLTSLSPCVWGLLPLTMSYIANASSSSGDDENSSTLLPTLSFAAGLSVVFCSLGMLAVELGGVFGGTTSSSDSGVNVLPLFSNSICLLMGLKLLELIDVPLPKLDALSKGPTSRGSSGSNEQPILIDGSGAIIQQQEQAEERNGLWKTFFLGGSSALVASPCATPVLTSILAFVAQDASNPLFGAGLLLFYSLGYATPLLLISATGGQLLNNLKKKGGNNALGSWVTPLTAGVLLMYGTNGMLTTLFGDPSMAGLSVLD